METKPTIQEVRELIDVLKSTMRPRTAAKTELAVTSSVFVMNEGIDMITTPKMHGRDFEILQRWVEFLPHNTGTKNADED
jgi:hypothetical protein